MACGAQGNWGQAGERGDKQGKGGQAGEGGTGTPAGSTRCGQTCVVWVGESRQRQREGGKLWVGGMG